MQHQLMADGQWLTAKFYSLIRTITVGIGISPIQSHISLSNLLLSTIRESWTVTTGRELHPAPSILLQR